MPSPKRECASCQFFQNAQLAGNGWCTHPKRQLASDVRILVRSRELACRNSWGDDLWAGASSPATTSGERAKSRPDAAEPVFQQDDTVTSVVDTGSHPGVRTSGPGNGEDQITHTAVRGEELPQGQRTVDDINVLANDDQTDRVRIMARGSKDAILRARERAAQRRQPARPMIEPAASEEKGSTPAQPVPGEPAPTGDSTINRMAAYERTPPVPREEVPSAGRETSPAVGPDDRFDSVPPIRADVELPRLRQFLRHGQTEKENARTLLPDVSMSSYDLVLRRAQEIKTSANHVQRPAAPTPPARPTRSQARPVVTPPPVAPEPEVPSPEPDLVWDLDVANLNVVFSRVRTVLDEEEARQDPRLRRQAPDSPVEAVAALEPYDAGQVDDDVLVDNVNIGFDADDVPDAIPERRPVAESPRGSWWRSLNFGIRRRVSLDERAAPLHVEAQHNDMQEWDEADELSLQGEPGWDEPEIGWYDEVEADFENGDSEFDDDRLAAVAYREDMVAYREDADDEFLDNEPDNRLITSESSWLEDEEQFPAAQPAAWRDQRAALLASSPFNQDIPLPPVPAVPQAEPPPAQVARAVEPVRPRSRRAYHVEDPGGFVAFREALFATAMVEPGAPPNSSEWQQPAQATTIREDEVVPVSTQAYEATRPAPRPRRGSSPQPSRITDRELRAAFTDKEDLAQHFEVASAVRKCCRTCRSFQAIDDQGHGRCGNSWSFTHRQMVNADELSCHSSIGDWWLADDLAWIPPDVSIVPETPHTDRLEMRQRERIEPPAEDGHRVRTRRTG